MYCTDSHLEEEPILQEQWEMPEEKLQSLVEQRRKESPSPSSLPPPTPPKIQLSPSTKNLVNPEYVVECCTCLGKSCYDKKEMMYRSKALDKDNDANIEEIHLQPFHETLRQVKLHESYHNEEKCKTHSCEGLSRSLFTDNDAVTTNSYAEIENGLNFAYWRQRFSLHGQNLFMYCQENSQQVEKCLFEEMTNKVNGVDDDGLFEYNNERNVELFEEYYQHNQEGNRKSAAIDWTTNNKARLSEASVHTECNYDKETCFQRDKADNIESDETKHDKAFSKIFTVIKRLERYAESNCSNFDNTYVVVGDKEKLKSSNELIKVSKSRNLVSVQVARELLNNM